MGCCSNSKLTVKQWLVLMAIGSVHFTASMCVSIQAPFYPAQAELKNATSSQYGFVFGIYELVSFIASPILGNYIDLMGAKLLLASGVMLAGVSSIFFGLLEFVPGPVPFVALSFLIRALEALGSSAAVTSAFAITAATFPDNMATTFATLETFYGLGYVIGPPLGAVLYSLGGFMTPFLTIGVVLVVDSLLIFTYMPKYPANKAARKGKLFDILKVPAVLLDSIAIAGVTLCVGFNSAVLEPHIRDFGLTKVAVGFVFVTHGATYALTTPIIGRLCDTIVNPRHMLLVGSVTVLISVFLVGPAPFLSIEPSLPLVLTGLIFLGLSMSIVLVSAFTDSIRSAVKAGFPDDIVTYALVSGLWAASFALGDFVGPSVAGLLMDWVGFRWGTMFIVAVQVIVFTSHCVFGIRQRMGRKKKRTIESKNELATDDPKEKVPLTELSDPYSSDNEKRRSLALSEVLPVDS